jgi:hypothetical protein
MTDIHPQLGIDTPMDEQPETKITKPLQPLGIIPVDLGLGYDRVGQSHR